MANGQVDICNNARAVANFDPVRVCKPVPIQRVFEYFWKIYFKFSGLYWTTGNNRQPFADCVTTNYTALDNGDFNFTTTGILSGRPASRTVIASRIEDGKYAVQYRLFEGIIVFLSTDYTNYMTTLGCDTRRNSNTTYYFKCVHFIKNLIFIF